MARRTDPQTPLARGDRLLVALFIIAGATFTGVAFWLLIWVR